MSDEGFGDIDSDDVYAEGDDQIDFSQVEAVQEQVDAVGAVEDDAERLDAAQRWAKELAGEEIA